MPYESCPQRSASVLCSSVERRARVDVVARSTVGTVLQRYRGRRRFSDATTQRELDGNDDERSTRLPIFYIRSKSCGCDGFFRSMIESRMTARALDLDVAGLTFLINHYAQHDEPLLSQAPGLRRIARNRLAHVLDCRNELRCRIGAPRCGRQYRHRPRNDLLRRRRHLDGYFDFGCERHGDVEHDVHGRHWGRRPPLLRYAHIDEARYDRCATHVVHGPTQVESAVQESTMRCNDGERYPRAMGAGREIGRLGRRVRHASIMHRQPVFVNANCSHYLFEGCKEPLPLLNRQRAPMWRTPQSGPRSERVIKLGELRRRSDVLPGSKVELAAHASHLRMSGAIGNRPRVQPSKNSGRKRPMFAYVRRSSPLPMRSACKEKSPRALKLELGTSTRCARSSAASRSRSDSNGNLVQTSPLTTTKDLFPNSGSAFRTPPPVSSASSPSSV